MTTSAHRKLLEKSILDVKKIIISNLHNIPLDNGALLNSAGISIFLLHYGSLFHDKQALLLSKEIMDRLTQKNISYSEEITSTVSFCSGILGTGWLYTYMDNKGLWINEFDLSDLDEIALNFFNRTISIDYHDFLHGASGALYYMSHREGKRSATIQKKMMSSLFEKAYYDDDRFFWEHYQFEEKKIEPQTINLGLSHGTPAILSVLCKINSEKDQKHQAEIISKIAKTLLQYKNNDNYTSIFPYTANLNSNNYSTNSRLGWCYGDLGVAISIWNAAVRLKDENLRKEALNILKHSTDRTIENSSIRDAGICHGAAGIAHIFYIFYQRTMENSFLECSNKWLKIGLSMMNQKSSLITGETKWTNDNGYVDSFSLLDGISGVGLSLLSRFDKGKLNWESSILI